MPVPKIQNLLGASTFFGFLFGILLAIAIFIVGVIITLAIWNWLLNIPIIQRLARSIYYKITGR